MSAARRKNAPHLDRETIVSAAMRIIDTEGLEAMSMRRLASELGVDVAAIYYHVPSKSALHSLLVDEVMSGMDLTLDDPAAPLDERLVTAAYAFRAALLEHPHAVPLAAGRSMRSAKQLRPVEQMLGILYDAGLGATDAVAAVDVLGQHVLGITGIHARHITDAAFPPSAEPFEELPPREFPNMTRALSEGEFLGSDEEFDRGIRALVRGLLVVTVPAVRAQAGPAGDATR